MCEVIGDLTTLPAFAGGTTAATVHRGPASEEGGEEGADGWQQPPAAAVGWANRMASARCVADPQAGSGAAGCLWQRAKVGGQGDVTAKPCSNRIHSCRSACL